MFYTRATRFQTETLRNKTTRRAPQPTIKIKNIRVPGGYKVRVYGRIYRS